MDNSHVRVCVRMVTVEVAMAVKGGRRRAVGEWGEDRAAQHLVEQGWSVVERNWRCREGEVDLVATDPDGVVVLVEVKTRSGYGYGDPLESITWAKAERLGRLLMRYRRERGVAGPMRVDAVGVVRAHDGVRLRHLRGVLG